MALALVGACSKDKTTALDITLEITGMIDEIRLDAVTVGGSPISLLGEQTLFPSSPRPLKSGEVLTIWFDDSTNGQAVVVTATGLLCAKDATAPVMSPSRMLAKGQTVQTTLALTSNGTVVCSDGGTAGAGGAGGRGGAGGAAGTAAAPAVEV